MAIMPTRRRYREIFRRVRVYLPVLFLLLAAMVLFLPISGSWLSRRAESEIRKRLGLNVHVDHIELTIASASAEARGVELLGDDGKPVFRLARIAATGSIPGLLSGGENWPETLIIDGLPLLQLGPNAKGEPQVTGPFSELANQLNKMVRPKRSTSAGATSSRSSLPAHTPEIILRDLPVEISHRFKLLPKTILHLSTVMVSARNSAEAPIEAVLAGVAEANGVESFSITATAWPEEGRLIAQGDLGGIRIPFRVPGLGGATAAARDVRVKFALVRSEEEDWLANTELTLGTFEVIQDGVGGERWSEAPLTLVVRAVVDPKDLEANVQEVSLRGKDVDIFAQGRVDASTPELPGELMVRVSRLPASLVALGRKELLGRSGVSIDESTSATLKVEANVAGPFGRPDDLTWASSIRIGGWIVNVPGVPTPVDVRVVDLQVSSSELGVEDLRINVGGLDVRVKGRVPLGTPEVPKYGALQLVAEGDSESAFAVAAELGVVPAEISSLKGPIKLDASMQFEGVNNRGQIEANDVEGSERVDFSWGESELRLRRFSAPIRFQPGNLHYTHGEAELRRFDAAIGNLNLRGDASVKRQESGAFNFDVNATSAGTLEELGSLLSQEVKLPRLPMDLRGSYRLTASAGGSTDRIDDTNYKASLLLENVGATVDTPYIPVRVKEAGAEISVDANEVAIRRASLLIDDPMNGDTRLQFGLKVNEGEIRLDATVRSTLEFLSALLPKDLHDLYMQGILPATAWVTLTPTKPLPPGKDVIRRWVAAFSDPKTTFAFKPGDTGDLKLDYEARYKPEGPINVTPRDFPIPLSNVRGVGVFTPEGIRMTDVLADFGSDKDIALDGLIELGRPTKITFNATAENINVNQWTSGWGERPWASAPQSFTPRWKSTNESIPFIAINGHVRTKNLQFMQFEGSNVDSKFWFEAWSRVPARMRLEEVKATLYGGETKGTLDFTFKKEERPLLIADLDFKEVNLQGFMDDLLERNQHMDGRIAGLAHFEGQLLNYPTYKGQGKYELTNSSFMNRIVFKQAGPLFRATSSTEGRDGRAVGTVSMANQEVHFPDMAITDPTVNMAVKGHIDFRGRLFFDLTANFLTKRIQNIPLIGIVGDVINVIGDELISYQLRGTLKEPVYRAAPTLMMRAEDFRGRFSGSGGSSSSSKKP